MAWASPAKSRQRSQASTKQSESQILTAIAIGVPRIPNTRGWIYRELQDFESAIRVNQEGTGMSHEMRFPEGIADSHIHLAGIHVTLGDLDRAREHLGKARLLLDDDPWFWWVYENRYRYELGRYWIAQGDLSQAKNAAGKLLDLANRTLKRKHIALGHMLRAEVAVLEENPEVAQVDYDKAFGLVDRYPCPTIRVADSESPREELPETPLF